MPLEAAWLISGAAGREEGEMSWISGWTLDSAQTWEKPISCDPFDIIKAYLPDSCGKYCESRGKNSIQY